MKPGLVVQPDDAHVSSEVVVRPVALRRHGAVGLFSTGPENLRTRVQKAAHQGCTERAPYHSVPIPIVLEKVSLTQDGRNRLKALHYLT